MKNVKSLTLLAAGALLAVNAQAGVLPGYSQNFSSVIEPTEIPWSFQNGDVYSGLAATEDGNQYLKVGHLSSAGNGRWSYLYWGQDALSNIPAEYANNNYEVSFDFFITASNNQYNSHLEIVTDTIVKRFQTWDALAVQGYAGDSVTVKAYDGVTDSTYFQPTVDAEGFHAYKEGYGNFLFSLYEKENGVFVVNGNENQTFTNVSNTWYHFVVSLDKTTKVASFVITDQATGATVLEGKRTLTGDLIIPTGINLFHARYTNVFGFDNIKAGVHVDAELPDAPGYVLKGVDGTNREYKFVCNEGEVIKYQLEDGLAGFDADDEPLKSTGVIDDIMKDGTMFTSSGTLKIWTEANGFSSEVVTLPIVCEWVKLPTPVATMTGASVGFDKSYQINVDNSNVPTKPTLGYKYAIYDENGALVETNGDSDEDALNGTTMKIGKGTLEIWAVSFGFKESDHVFFTNDTPYTLDEANDVLDFQHFTADQLTNYGFTFTDLFESTTTSGESNWVARCRIYDFILKEGADINNPQAGDTLVFADRFVGQAPANAYTFPSLNRYGYPDYATNNDSAKAYNIFPHLGLWWKDRLGGKEMGLNFTEQIGFYGNSTSYNAIPIQLHGLSEDDMTLVYTLNNYGGNSIHNVVFSEDAAKAANHAPITHVIKGNGSFTINRIDEAVAKVEFLKAGTPEAVAEPASKSDAIKTIDAVKVDDPNAPVYNLRGVKVNKNSLTPGIYIQNGKKFLVK